ncbi:long-chain fatty acid transport protein 1 [Anabrus simplex]|uniref:long-chain fatty acid transport protein 1 n=1 Tax=Anabrus simplex TaxID=316456 RepID=UPI0035A28C9E
MLPENPAVVTGLVAGSAAVSLLLGRRLIPQLLLLFIFITLATGGRYKWLYIVYKTLPRDLKALYRFIQVNALLWWWETRHFTVAQLFVREVRRHPDKVAFYFEKRQLTFREVDELSNQIAHYFKSQGFRRDDTIALIMESKPEYVCLWLGLSKIGVVAALVNFNLRQGPLVHSIKAANSKGVIVGSELTGAVKEVLGDLSGLPLYQYTEVGSSAQSLLPGAIDLNTALSSASKSPLTDDMAGGSPREKLVYIYTSGTTGLPKAAVVNNLRYMFMVVGVNRMLSISSKDTLYDPLPLYHTAGGMIGVGQALLMGSTVAIRRKFSASNFWTDCIAYKCTVAQYIGEICRYLLSVAEKKEETLHSVRLMFGNGLRPQIWKQFVERFHVAEIGEFYGSTEGNSNLVNIDNTTGAVGFVPRYASSVYPVGLIRVDEDTGEPIRDKSGLCIRCQPGEPGIFVGKINPKKAISDFSGYADKSASEKKIIKDVFAKGDRAFNSGDLLVMDTLGYFYFKDRTGDTFRWRGENVSTSEVEAVISNVVGLKDAVVYGVEIPNLEGRAGMAAIVDQDNSLDLELLLEGIKKNLPPYARPLFIRVLHTLPMTGTFKLKKRDLQVEGFDPNIIRDNLYFMNNTGKFVPLTKELHEDIITGKVRL